MLGLFNEPAGPSAGPSVLKSEPAPQVSFNDMLKEIHAQNIHIQILEQQSETMTQALL